MILNCLYRKALPIYGNGTHVRDWLHVDDHVAALHLLLKHGRSGETYNIGGNAEWRNIDLVHAIIRCMANIEGKETQDYEKLITFVNDRPGHDLRYAIDCIKINKEIGWGPLKSFDEGLIETILWYMQNKTWVDNVHSGAYRDWLDANYAIG